MNIRTRVWAARLLIGLVFFFNVQCAIVFLWQPQVYAPGFELAGIAGEGMVRGMGVLFLMWNVPYAVALWQPVKHRHSLLEALVMQALGVVGESLILLTLPAGHATLTGSVTRFIVFDAAGLLFLLAAWVISRKRAA